MATEEASGRGLDIGGAEALQSLLEAYDELEIPFTRYLTIILLPAFVFFFITLIAAAALPLPLAVRLPIPLLGILILGAAAIYPKLVFEQRKRSMEDRYHLLITHMTVLSTTNIDRMEVFRTLAREKEYGELAAEMGRVVALVDAWNQSLDDACRRRAKQVPSEIVADLFDRLAYSLGSGQQLDDFLLSEQDVVVRQYSTIYESALDNLEVMKDLYVSMILSMTFALVFAVVLPVLTGEDPMLLVAAVIVIYVFVQSGFAFAIRSISPSDPIWYHPPEIDTDIETKIDLSLVVSVVLVVFLLTVAFGGRLGVLPFGLAALIPGFSSIPVLLFVAIPLTPLMIPGIVVGLEERRIQDRDDAFPSFIRALGSSETARQSTTTAVLSDLRDKDFGALTPTVDDLYTRLNMRIDPAGAWRNFAADTRSFLIQKFSEMYLTGRTMGGEPKRLGELISENMTEVNQLRERRKQATRTLIGLLYGITASSTFAFFVGLKIVVVLADMTTNLFDSAGAGDYDFSSIIHTQSYNIAGVEYLLILLILFNALSSAILIRTVDDGHKMNAYPHFVALIWVSSLIALVTKTLVGSFLAV